MYLCAIGRAGRRHVVAADFSFPPLSVPPTRRHQRRRPRSSRASSPAWPRYVYKKKGLRWSPCTPYFESDRVESIGHDTPIHPHRHPLQLNSTSSPPSNHTHTNTYEHEQNRVGTGCTCTCTVTFPRGSRARVSLCLCMRDLPSVGGIWGCGSRGEIRKRKHTAGVVCLDRLRPTKQPTPRQEKNPRITQRPAPPDYHRRCCRPHLQPLRQGARRAGRRRAHGRRPRCVAFFPVCFVYELSWVLFFLCGL